MIVNDKLVYTLAAVMLFAGGYITRGQLHECPVAEPKVVTQVEYRDRVQTEVAYVPKETIIYKDGSTGTEKTDVDIKINKPALNVKVNDKTFAVTKADDEQFLFDKNKLTMTQNSTADLHITVPVVDKTKRWAIGAGVSKDGAVGLVGFPVTANIGGWIVGNEDNVMGGVTVRF